MNTKERIIQQLLVGAYDLHMHTQPSPFNRALDEYGILREAGSAGMAGVMLKSHYESTAARAELVNRYAASCTRAYGGLVLNWPVGGLNPYAVHNALKHGCRIVWMPTRDAANSLRSGHMPGDFFERKGITLLDENGGLLPVVYEILDAVKAYDACLATGHISPEESVLLCRAGRARGVRMVMTHPEFERTVMPPATQKELADLGVYMEKCWYNIGEKAISAEEMAAHIRQVGAERCFMTTDRGQANREHPVEAMKLFLGAMLDQGLTPEELYAMTHTVPEKILGLASSIG